VNDQLVFGLQVAPIVKALVDVLKRLGVKGNGSLIAAMAVAAGLVALREIAAMYPTVEPWFHIVVMVFSTALWASTLHDGVKALNGRAQT